MLLLSLFSFSAVSKEWLIETDIDARAEYNDNIFLSPLPHDSVSGVIVTPSIKGVVREAHWQADMTARLRSNNYSNSRLNSNDRYFDLTGRYNVERNLFSLNMNYDLDSNLNAASPDFGLTLGQRVERKNQSITPSYTRFFTERLLMSLSYTYSDVYYFDADRTGYIPYITESVAFSLAYDLSEKDKLTFSFSAVDYTSQDELLTYQLFMPRMGIEHEFSSTFSFNFMAGTSRRNSTNKTTQSFDFFGQPIIITREIDASDRGFVLDAGFRQDHETGAFTGSITRDNTTNSYGGLNEVDSFKLGYNSWVTDLLRYSLIGRYKDYSAVSSGLRDTDRKALFLEGILNYSLSRDWRFNASYRYVQRRFKNNDSSGSKAPYSNRVYVSLTYNFPDLSTF